MGSIKLLALSGSLRKSSYNTAALKALELLAPSHIDISVGSIANLPLFNPDREEENIPALENLKSALHESDGLIIASPEYAHGVSGPLKNALDWLVSGSEFPAMPIMLINTSPRASHAQTSLKEILATMSGNVIQKAHVAIPLLGSELDTRGIVASKELAALLLNGLGEFTAQIAVLRLDDRMS